MKVLQYPEIEQRLNPKKENRFYVADCPESFKQDYGFKTETSLRKCYTWWYHNVYLKNTDAKTASLEWELRGRDSFHNTIKNKSQENEFKTPGLKIKAKLTEVPEIDISPVDEDDVPAWI